MKTRQSLVLKAMILCLTSMLVIVLFGCSSQEPEVKPYMGQPGDKKPRTFGSAPAPGAPAKAGPAAAATASPE